MRASESRGRKPDTGSIDARAAEWLARRDAGLSCAEETRFGEWLASDPRHARAVLRLERTWAILVGPRRAGHAWLAQAALDGRVRRRRRRRWAGLIAAAALAVGAPLGLFLRGEATGADAVIVARAPATVLARPDFMGLPDGSGVQLNAASAIEVEFSADVRSVALTQGGAFFRVAKDSRRPFVVRSAGVIVRAVGTEFSVARTPDGVEVIVAEGRVVVGARAAPEASLLELTKGELVVIPSDGSVASLPDRARVVDLPDPELTASLAWRESRVEFAEMPLGEVIELFNRRNELQLIVRGHALLHRRINGVFWTNDPEGFARVVAESLAAGVELTEDGWVLTEIR
jgi:transmembrane sensor